MITLCEYAQAVCVANSTKEIDSEELSNDKDFTLAIVWDYLKAFYPKASILGQINVLRAQNIDIVWDTLDDDVTWVCEVLQYKIEKTKKGTKK